MHKERSIKAIMRTPVHHRSLYELEHQVQIAGVSARGYINRARILSEECTNQGAYRDEIRTVLEAIDEVKKNILLDVEITEDEFKSYRISRKQNLK
jgi:hypothetical protein